MGCPPTTESFPVTVLLHITPREDWERAERDGIYRAASLETEGFIHCSTPAQVVGTATRFYRGQTGLVLLVIDAEKLQAEVRYEDADGQMFPHIYGPLNLDAVTRVLPFEPSADRTFTLPPL